MAFRKDAMGAAVEEGSSGDISGRYHLSYLSGIDPSGAFPFPFPFSPPSLPQSQFWEPKCVLDYRVGIGHTMAVWIRAE